MKKLLIIPMLLGTLALGGLAGYAGLASADDTNGSTAKSFAKNMMGRFEGNKMGNHVDGTVTKIDGTVITLTDDKDNTTYTIETKDADIKIFTEGKAPTDGALSDIKVGDNVMVRGTISGTEVTATDVMSGAPEGGMGHGMGGRGHGGGMSGRGVMGTVKSVNGTSVTLEGKDGKTYTVNAGDASVTRMIDGALSDVVAGDLIGVHGTMDGTTITAKHIMDDMK